MFKWRSILTALALLAALANLPIRETRPTRHLQPAAA